jgi:hypothetical protein
MSEEPCGIIQAGYRHDNPNLWRTTALGDLDDFDPAARSRVVAVSRLVAMTASGEKQLPLTRNPPFFFDVFDAEDQQSEPRRNTADVPGILIIFNSQIHRPCGRLKNLCRTFSFLHGLCPLFPRHGEFISLVSPAQGRFAP